MVFLDLIGSIAHQGVGTSAIAARLLNLGEGILWNEASTDGPIHGGGQGLDAVALRTGGPADPLPARLSYPAGLWAGRLHVFEEAIDKEVPEAANRPFADAA